MSEVTKGKSNTAGRIVTYLLSEEQVTPLASGVDIHPYETEGLEDIDVNDLYSFLNKLVVDYKVANNLSIPPTYDVTGEDPYQYSPVDNTGNTFTIFLNENFKKWGEDYLSGNKEVEAAPEPKTALHSGFTTNDLPFSDMGKMESLQDDKIKLVNKLLQLCKGENTEVELLSSGESMFDPDRAGFTLDETIDDLLEAEVIKEIDGNHDKAGTAKVAVNLGKLQRYAETLHDEIEIHLATVLGIEQQKRNILRLLNDRFNKNPTQQVFTYSEKILGPYNPHDPSKPAGSGFWQNDQNRPDTKYQFMRTMRALEAGGHFKILNVEIDFDAQPKPVGKFLSALDWDVEESGYYPKEFYPPEHCKVTLKVTRAEPTREEKLSYNPAAYVLSFKGKEISIPQNTNQDQLCRVLFKSGKAMKMAWNWDEMIEEWGGKEGYEEEAGKDAWRKVYNAAKEVNKRVAIDTGIKDLLIVKTQTTTVNPKYLP